MFFTLLFHEFPPPGCITPRYSFSVLERAILVLSPNHQNCLQVVVKLAGMRLSILSFKSILMPVINFLAVCHPEPNIISAKHQLIPHWYCSVLVTLLNGTVLFINLVTCAWITNWQWVILGHTSSFAIYTLLFPFISVLYSRLFLQKCTLTLCLHSPETFVIRYVCSIPKLAKTHVCRRKKVDLIVSLTLACEAWLTAWFIDLFRVTFSSKRDKIKGTESLH